MFIFYVPLLAINMFLNGVLVLVAGLLNIILNLNKFLDVGVVQTGWAVTLSFTNSFFGLILLVIAFGIILGIEKIGTKQLIVDLIISVFLINFSLAIAGVFIDFSQVLTEQFLSPIINSPAGIAGSLLGGSAIDKLYKPSDLTPDSPWDKLKKSVAVVYNAATASPGMVIDILFTNIFLVILVFALLAMVVTLFYRIVFLWILLILSPIIWAFRILPSTQEYWGKWWTEFWKWTMFAPSYSFFIYLAVSMANTGSINKLLDGQNFDPHSNIFLSTFTSSASYIMQFAALIIILLAGLVLSTQAGHASMKLGKGLAAKFTGLQAAGRYKDAIKGQFKKREEEKVDIAKGRVEGSRKRFASQSGPLGWAARSPKEDQKKIAEKRDEESDRIVEQLKRDPDKLKEVQKQAGSWNKVFRNPVQYRTAGNNALALAKFDKHRENEYETRLRSEGRTKPEIKDAMQKYKEAREDEYGGTGGEKRHETMLRGQGLSEEEITDSMKRYKDTHEVSSSMKRVGAKMKTMEAKQVRQDKGAKSEEDEAIEHLKHLWGHKEEHKPAGEGGAHANEKPAAGSNKDDHGHA